MAARIPLSPSRSEANQRSLAPTRGSGRVSLCSAGQAASASRHFFLVGRLLGPKDRYQGFKGTISSIWRIRKGLSVYDAGERFLFQFDHSTDRNRVFNGGPWHYRNTMLVLNLYDGIQPVEEVPLMEMVTWAAVRGLPVNYRNDEALTSIGDALGQIVHFDRAALYRRDEEQRIKLRFDVRDRIRSWMQIEISHTIKPELTIIFEKVKGFCRACGLLIHDASGCDNYLYLEKEDLLNDVANLNIEGLNIDNPRLGLVNHFPESVLNGDDVAPPTAVPGRATEVVHLVDNANCARQDDALSFAPGDQVVVHSGGAIQMMLDQAGALVQGRFASAAPPLVNHLKRLAVSDLPRPRKKFLSSKAVSVEDDGALVIQHKNGKLWVSPKKKKGRGRPKGSTNRPKVAKELDLDKGSGTTKRKYKAKKPDPNLNLGENQVAPIPAMGDEASTPAKGEDFQVPASEVLAEKTEEVEVSTFAASQ